MKIVRLKNNVVIEVIPDSARPIEDWYNAEFVSQCMEVPSNVDQHWIYDTKNQIFSPPNTKTENLSEENVIDKLLSAFI